MVRLKNLKIIIKFNSIRIEIIGLNRENKSYILAKITKNNYNYNSLIEIFFIGLTPTRLILLGLTIEGGPKSPLRSPTILWCLHGNSQSQ